MPSLRPLWTVSQRRGLIVVLLIATGWIAWRLIANPYRLPDPQPPVGDLADKLADRIDPNTADAVTLAALPQVGPKRAADIIAHREQFVARHPGKRAFEKPEDLLRIRGIGVAMQRQLSPYLIFGAESSAQNSPATEPSVDR